MADAYKLIWAGRFHTLRVERHWNAFWGLAATCEFADPRRKVMLPPGAMEHLCRIYNLVEEARGYFVSSDHWWNWQRRLCDDFADCFISKRPRAGNDFWDIPGALRDAEGGVKMSAFKAKGFSGPADWQHG